MALELHNVTVRCGHGFAEGYCVCAGCPHQEKRGRRVYDKTTARRVRIHPCSERGCDARGVVSRREQRNRQRDTYWYCAECAERLGVEREEAA